MALTAEQGKFIASVGEIAHQLLELQGDMLVVNTLWFGSPDWDTLMADVEIAEMPGLADAGLTNAKIGNAVFTIEAIRQAVLGGNLADLVLLAQLR